MYTFECRTTWQTYGCALEDCPLWLPKVSNKSVTITIITFAKMMFVQTLFILKVIFIKNFCTDWEPIDPV